MRSFRVNSFSEMLIAEGRSSNTTFLPKLVTACLTAIVWIAWSVVFLSFAIISGSTALRCLVNRVSFIILLGGSLVVMEKLTFSGSRHLAKYCADSSSECSFTFSMFASAQVIDTGHFVTSGGNPQSLILRVLDISIVGVA